MLVEISKLTTKNKPIKVRFFLQIFFDVIFLLEILSTYMTMVLIICDYSLGAVKTIQDVLSFVVRL